MARGRYYFNIGILVFVLFALSGCGYKNIKEDTVEFRRDGSVRSVTYDSFPSDLYDFPSLKEEVNEAVAAYNEESEKPRIKLKDIAFENNFVRLVLYYDTPDDYVLFNNMLIFEGTIDEALNSGIADGSMMFRDTEGKETKTLGQILQSLSADEVNDAYRIAVVSESQKIEHYGEIEYFTSNCNPTDDDAVKSHIYNDSDKAAVIYRILKRR